MEIPHLTEEEMTEIKKDALDRLRPYLCDKITAERHFDYLRSKKILTREDTEEISWKVTSRQKTSKLLDYLAENPKGLDTLIESIQNTRCSDFIITKITDEVQRLKNERIESLKASYSAFLPTKSTGATNDLSRTFSDDSNFDKGCVSTLLFHPEGEWSPSVSSTTASLNVPHGPTSEAAPLCSSVIRSATSGLPRPGDDGAPPLPPELQAEAEGACGSTTGSDSAFQPLRSRCISQPRQNAPLQSSR
ncbi:B-cell lymphoma/leukemia 10 isoform X2 [Brienomyrus brachyistius]|uniref:B-cell lymphoma/leukemia 10 isoform X2 n=1 Tax=Brienomyrus brachyistius TaxID=42636 RepID=UPI0020B29BDD|nr:B-cell lymphoma/leukemia 10 isoform X2 [Brienomyrus brachyistius]